MKCARWILLLLLTYVLSGAMHSDAAEIGSDLGIAVQLDRAHDVFVALPMIHSGQVIRVGLALSEYDEIEFAPWFTYSSSDATEPRSSISLGLSYMRGRVSGGHPAPYIRVGGRWGRDSFSDSPYDFSVSQFSILSGVGLKWRLGKVIGLCCGASAERKLESPGALGGWELYVLIGVSAFSDGIPCA